MVGGSQGVVAIVPQGVRKEAVAECADALVMRVKDAAAATELRKKLMQSASQMAAVAGLLKVREQGSGWFCKVRLAGFILYLLAQRLFQ